MMPTKESLLDRALTIQTEHTNKLLSELYKPKPKPLNNKKRKLQYIRKKNALRKGAVIRGACVVHIPEIEQEGALEDILNIQIAEMSRKWKTPMVLHGLNPKRNPDDSMQLIVSFTVIAESHAE